jgi:hypothetical protein
VTTVAEPLLIDRDLRDLLVRDLPEAYVEDAMSLARTRLAAELETQPPRAPRRRLAWPRMLPVRVAFALGVLLAVLVVAVAVDPFDDGSAPHLAKDATAAEALTFAGGALDEQRDLGPGHVLHATRLTRTDGVVTERVESWIDVESPRFRIARITREQLGGRMMLQVEDFDGTVERRRTYDSNGQRWTLAASTQGQVDIPGGAAPAAQAFGGLVTHPVPEELGGAQATGPIELSDAEVAARATKLRRMAAAEPRGRVSVNATIEQALRTWIEAVRGARDEQQLVRPTVAFMASTRGFFYGLGDDATPAAIRATSVRQLLYLAEQAPIDADALRFLYGRIGHLGDLERLSDVTVDGRRAARIQFDGVRLDAIDPAAYVDPADAASLLRGLQRTPVVAILDLESGLIVRLESVDRSVVLELDAPAYVVRVGAGAAACGPGSEFGEPCALLDRTGPLARRADAQARAPFNVAAGISEATGADTLGGATGLEPQPSTRPALPWSPKLPPGALG